MVTAMAEVMVMMTLMTMMMNRGDSEGARVRPRSRFLNRPTAATVTIFGIDWHAFATHLVVAFARDSRRQCRHSSRRPTARLVAPSSPPPQQCKVSPGFASRANVRPPLPADDRPVRQPWEAIMALFTCSTLAAVDRHHGARAGHPVASTGPVFFNSWYFARWPSASCS